MGYVGRDVESIVRDLVGKAFQMVRQERAALVEEEAKRRVDKRLLDLVLPPDETTSRDDAEAAPWRIGPTS